jgi:glycosyltransferase involved in cell wall biosynthesis
MKKVSIITRAYNRLEYTIKCINSVCDNTIYPEYEHIIINNNSTDGTKEWLNWIKGIENRWFEKVIPIHLNKNLKDFGGMIVGTKYISKDSEYIVQLDNDIEVPKGWLTALVKVIEHEIDSKAVMLKRTGVKTIITPKNIRTVDDYEYGDIPIIVACYIIKTNDFINVMNECKNCSGLSGKLKKLIKIINVKCNQIEGWNGETYIQHEKYQPSSKRIYLHNN